VISATLRVASSATGANCAFFVLGSALAMVNEGKIVPFFNV
jgi:hypothetical protein